MNGSKEQQEESKSTRLSSVSTTGYTQPDNEFTIGRGTSVEGMMNVGVL